MNAVIFNTLINGYNAIAYTHEYIFGFIDRHNVYACFATADMLPYICKLDKASRGAGYSLRFTPTVAQKELLKTKECFVVCSEKYFNELHKASKYNRGEIFEKLVTEHFGQVWEKDTVPFTEAGDIEANGIAYQVKFEKATFCSEASLASLQAKIPA